jgi:hypothetical protein
MSYEIIGIIQEIYETMTFESGFQKREFVLNVSDNPDYPKYPKFEMTKDKVDFLDKYKVGDQVKVKFGLGGNRWDKPDGTTQYFTSLSAFYIGGAHINPSEPQQSKPTYTAPQAGQYQGSPAKYDDPINKPKENIDSHYSDDVPF